MKIKIIIVLIVLTCGGCNLPYRPLNYQDSLNQRINNNLSNMIGMNNQIGAIAGCPSLIKRVPLNTRLYSVRVGTPPTNRVDWMKWNVTNLKLGK